MTKSLLIGLTGGIGSGKTTVAKIFTSLGYPVFNSDTEAKNIVNNNAEAIVEIKRAFGDVYQDGVLNSKKIANLVFKNKEALQQLNAIVHPKVKAAFENWVRKHKEHSVLLKEAAILFETEGYKLLDATILVVAPEKIRIKRVMSRDRIEEEAVKNRIQNQLSDEKKKLLAQYVIVNDDENLLIPQVLEIVQQIKGE